MESVLRLAEILACPPETIELIPGDGREWLESHPENEHAPFLFLEGHLGVPEKILYQSYLLSVKTLGEPKKSIQTLDGRNLASKLTRVILLANPAHQSVLNARKRILLACHDELAFIASLLSARQCSKVSTLWHHRRALLSVLSSQSASYVLKPFDHRLADEHFEATANLLSVSLLRTELDVAARACEIYPRNYYAWHHRRSACGHVPQRLIVSLLKDELASLERWIDRHVSDHSAVDYICLVVEELRSPGLGADAVADCVERCRRHALGLVRSYPSHEALWLYVRRTMVMEGMSRISEGSTLDPIEQAQEGVKTILQAAKQRYDQPDKLDPETELVIRHALRFLLWSAKTVRWF
ncbi:protein prenylyltransferase [Phellopilus nigrolimitatus]|nr:protein prenylyltransferase [Phellopilus nigrolimitatus]